MVVKDPNIVVIGSYAVGMTMLASRFPAPGETVLGHSFRQLHGGKGSNQAIAAARLGAAVTFGGRVGKDDLGERAMTKLRSEGVGIDHLSVDEAEPTGVGFVVVSEAGENQIVIDFGANRRVTPEHVRHMSALIAQADMVVLQLEISADAVGEAVSLASDAGVPVLLNPAPYQPVEEDTLKRASFLTPNESEAKALLGYDATDDSPHEELASKLHDRYGCTVVMTLGADGALFRGPNVSGNAGGFRVQAVDTTGAGDTFSAAFAVAIAEGKRVDEAARFANAAAALSVKIAGVVPSLPKREAVEEFMRAEKEAFK